MAIDAQGRIVVVGLETDADENFAGLVLVLAPDGTELWTRRFAAALELDAVFNDVVVGDDGAIFVAGWDASRLGVVRRLDRDGNDVWAYSVPTPDEESSSVTALVLAHEGLYSLGEAFNDSTGTHMVLRRHNVGSGAPVWETPAKAEGSTRGYGLTEANGRLIVAGAALPPGEGKDRPLTAVFDASGALQSLAVETGTSGAWHAVTAIGEEGDVVLTGWLSQGKSARRIAADGSERWTHLLDTSNYGYGGLGVAADFDGSVLVTGSVGDGPAQEDLYMARLEGDGAARWSALYDNTTLGFSERGYDVAVGPEFFVVVGFETVAISDTDLWIRRFVSG
ncbi:hypothetical protein [Nannocystis bainbridge]|uniref:Uncharacterized protein n=1 Tax=Nannocystis bainbridge TaxID=2995303 RepID=A0ABT5DZL0_9BACT|nr:hypothetical protein [Nannocystis bainbridge]MDC0719069.1 hypothetical protein [Nannocystis bainbridge]